MSARRIDETGLHRFTASENAAAQAFCAVIRTGACLKYYPISSFRMQPDLPGPSRSKAKDASI